jgi:hypothetical protein
MCVSGMMKMMLLLSKMRLSDITAKYRFGRYELIGMDFRKCAQ